MGAKCQPRHSAKMGGAPCGQRGWLSEGGQPCRPRGPGLPWQPEWLLSIPLSGGLLWAVGLRPRSQAERKSRVVVGFLGSHLPHQPRQPSPRGPLGEVVGLPRSQGTRTGAAPVNPGSPPASPVWLPSRGSSPALGQGWFEVKTG